MWWRSPSVLAIGAIFIALATTAAHAAETVRLLRVAGDADAVVVKDERAQLHVVRVGERVLDSAWTLQNVRAGGATFAYGSIGATGSSLIDVLAGEPLDLARNAADVVTTPQPAVISMHGISVDEDKRGAH